MYRNFAAPMKVLANPYPRTPAMAAGISDHVPKIQIATVAGLMEGKRLDAPPLRQTNVSYLRAESPDKLPRATMELFGRAAEEPEDYGSN